MEALNADAWPAGALLLVDSIPAINPDALVIHDRDFASVHGLRVLG